MSSGSSQHDSTTSASYDARSPSSEYSSERHGRRRAMNPTSTSTAASANHHDNPRKIRKLEKKLGKLDEKLNVPTDKKFKFHSNRDEYNLNTCVLLDLRAAKKCAKSRRTCPQDQVPNETFREAQQARMYCRYCGKQLESC